MKVNELSAADGFKALVLADGEREITGVYIGDLLSWVMGRAQSGDAWITIMSNINIIAVASLADTSCIIVSEDVALDEDIKNKANEKGINIISSSFGIYETALALNRLL